MPSHSYGTDAPAGPDRSAYQTRNRQRFGAALQNLGAVDRLRLTAPS
jgi:hypothetical protein